MTTVRVSGLIVAVLGAVVLVGATPRETVQPPDDDFLEFLGSWHTGEDRWVDPFQTDEGPVSEAAEPSAGRPPRDVQGRARARKRVSGDEASQQKSDPTIPPHETRP